MDRDLEVRLEVLLVAGDQRRVGLGCGTGSGAAAPSPG